MEHQSKPFWFFMRQYQEMIQEEIEEFYRDQGIFGIKAETKNGLP